MRFILLCKRGKIMMIPDRGKKQKVKSVSYAKWGYIFLIPFFVVYIVFSLIPLVSTIYYSFFENYLTGLKQVGPNYVGLANYKELLNADLLKYTGNTIIMWILGFIPQILLALLLAVWFTDLRLKIKAQGFFKVIIYMPNLIMATAFSMLFYTLFADAGPINNILMDLGIIDEPFRFLANKWGARGLVAGMNFMMWFGNTTIIIMAAIMSIDTALFEAAQIDGAKSIKMFRYITIPIIKPMLAYVMITSMIGGIQMFDIPQILSNGTGAPDRSTMTLIMYLNNHLYNKNYGLAGALSVILFILTAVLSIGVFISITGGFNKKED